MQAQPGALRSKEDQALLDLAEQEGMRRCPACGAMVQRTQVSAGSGQVEEGSGLGGCTLHVWLHVLAACICCFQLDTADAGCTQLACCSKLVWMIPLKPLLTSIAACRAARTWRAGVGPGSATAAASGRKQVSRQGCVGAALLHACQATLQMPPHVCHNVLRATANASTTSYRQHSLSCCSPTSLMQGRITTVPASLRTSSGSTRRQPWRRSCSRMPLHT